MGTERQQFERLVYAARSRDCVTLSRVASGGVLTELAEFILGKKGVVIGAAWCGPDMHVEHLIVNNEKDLWLLSGSKYVDSNLAPRFEDMLNIIRSGKLVLFSGTPCQVAALRRRLEFKSYNLFCVEIFCHGVPMRSVWYEYIRQLKDKVVHVDFRSKKKSWNDPLLIIKFENREPIQQPLYDNAYGQAFLAGLSIRETCHNCRYKCGKSGADISVGDFWGVERHHPEFADGNGCNAVVINSCKGENLFKCVSPNLSTVKSQINFVTVSNPAYLMSVPRPMNKDYFLKKFKIVPMEQLVHRCIYGVWYVRIIRSIIRRVRLYSRI